MKRVVLIFLVGLLAASCHTLFLSSNVRKLELGMSKNQVVHIVGSDYRVAYSDAGGVVWKFTPVTNEPYLECYLLTFQGDNLAAIETLVEPNVHFDPHAGHRHN